VTQLYHPLADGAAAAGARHAKKTNKPSFASSEPQREPCRASQPRGAQMAQLHHPLAHGSAAALPGRAEIIDDRSGARHAKGTNKSLFANSPPLREPCRVSQPRGAQMAQSHHPLAHGSAAALPGRAEIRVADVLTLSFEARK